MADARRVVALADARTPGATVVVQFAPLDEVDEVAGTGRVSDEASQPFYDRGVRVVQSAPDSVVGPPASIMEESIRDTRGRR
jgi:hypothetical protein